MKNAKHFPTLPANNIFADQFETFQQSKLYQRLDQKFTPLPYYVKYRALKGIALTASYLFNLFSGLTASTLVYFFVLGVSNNWIISGFCTLTFIVLIEIAKRKTNGIFWKDWLQYKKLSYSLLAILGLLIGLSVIFSYFGSKQLVQRFTPPPIEVQSDTLTYPIQNEIKAIDLQINKARSTKWKGTTTSTSQRTIETLSKQKLALQERLLSIQNNTEVDNKTIHLDHKSNTYLESENFALITLLLELLFILCAFYLEYYDFRSFAEFSITQTTKTLRQNNNITENSHILAIPHTNKRHTDNRISSERICQTCSIDITHKRKDAKFCSENCRREHWATHNGREPYLKAKK